MIYDVKKRTKMCYCDKNNLYIALTSCVVNKMQTNFISRPPDELYENESFDISDDEDGNLKPKRQHWSSKMQFVLACIGYSVGLSNVWRFPWVYLNNLKFNNKLKIIYFRYIM